MLISSEFDESNRRRRLRIYSNALETAEKLNTRIRHFIKNNKENASLAESQRKQIIEKIFAGIEL